MMICNQCRCELPDNAKFCFECGANITGKIKCTSCGEDLPAEAKFCYACGTKIGSAKDENKLSLDNLLEEINIQPSTFQNAGSQDQGEVVEPISSPVENVKHKVAYYDLPPNITRKDKVVLILESVKDCSSVKKLHECLWVNCALEMEEATEITDNLSRVPIIIHDDISYGQALFMQDHLERLGCRVLMKIKK